MPPRSAILDLWRLLEGNSEKDDWQTVRKSADKISSLYMRVGGYFEFKVCIQKLGAWYPIDLLKSKRKPSSSFSLNISLGTEQHKAMTTNF